MFGILKNLEWPIWPLLLTSVCALAIVIERFVSLQRKKIAPDNLLEEACSVTRSNSIGLDLVQQLHNHSLMGSIFSAGVEVLRLNFSASKDDIESAMELSGRHAVAVLSKFLPALAAIASVAPLLGLLGTVVGMIAIFGAQSATGASDPVTLAKGISLALYATAMGLIVAIPSLLFWRFFKSKVDAYVLEFELSSEKFLNHLLRLQQSSVAAHTS